MTDVSTFGGGLAPQIATTPAPQPQGFGSALQSFLPGPHYTQLSDPNATPLDQSVNLLSQQVQRASSVATNPWFQILDPDGVNKARSLLPQMTEQLQKQQQQRQQQKDIQSRATNFGVPKSQQNPYMTDDTIDNYLLDRYKNGDFTAANDLKARGKDAWVTDFAAQAVDGAGRKLASAQTAADKLTAGAASGQAAYASALRTLSPQDKQALNDMGMQTIPQKATDWDATVQQHGAMFAQAQQLHAHVVQQLNNMTNFDTPVPKDVGDSMAAGVTLGSTGEPAFDGQKAKLRGQDGQIGVVGPNGSVRTDKFGLSPSQGGWSATTAERLDKSDKMFTGEEVKGAINQYNIANKFQHEASDENTYNSSAGLALLKDTLGSVGRDVAEKSAAAGTTGLSKMFSAQQGGVEGFVNKTVSELNALQIYLDGGSKGPPPKRISDLTKQGIQAIAKANYEFALTQGSGRLAGAMRYAGQIGRPLEDIPLDAKLKEGVARYHEEGRIDAVNGFNSYPSLVRGNQRIYFPQGANVPGASGPRPALPFPANPNPPANTNTQPSQTGGNSPAAPNNSAGGGPASPATIAGQNLNFSLPAGATSGYVQAVQRIESGGSKDPWTATTPGSTASGAFQFIDKTWAANKPPGAPTRAKDATPAQQAEAFSNLTRKNADSLTASGLPVNNTNLYIAHNLGAGGASSMLRAAPNADARTIVGEEAANNNSSFFKGRPTVATVLGRYRDAMARNDTSPPSAPISGPNVAGQSGAGEFRTGRRDIDETDVVQKAVENAPTLGGMAGSMAGPVGGRIGGAAGGAAGQMFQNYMNGEDILQPNVIGSAGFGAAGGIATSGIKGAVLRAATAAAGGGVQGGVESGVSGAIQGAARAGAGAILGEGAAGAAGAGARAAAAGTSALLDRFGGFLGMSGHQTFSRLTPAAQQAYLDAAHVVANGKPEPPASLPGGGKNEVAVKAYEEKLADYEDAERHLKAVLPHVKPEEAAYAASQAAGSDPAARGEALTERPIAAEKTAVGKGLNEIRAEAATAAESKGLAGSLSAASALPDGPLSQLRTTENPSGKIPYNKDVETAFHNAEMLTTSPAPGGLAQVWNNTLKAREELLEQERTAIGGASPDPTKAKAMRAGAKALRPEIERIANGLFGEGAPAVLQRLDALHARYARVMKLSDNGDIAGTIAKGGKAGREANQAFSALAMGDATAQRVMNALVRLKRGVPWQEVGLMVPVIAGELGTGHGGLVSGPLAIAKLTQLAHDFIVKRGAGKPVKMDDLIKISKNVFSGGSGELQRAGAIAGAAATQQ